MSNVADTAWDDEKVGWIVMSSFKLDLIYLDSSWYFNCCYSWEEDDHREM